MLLYDTIVVATTVEHVLTLDETKAHLNVLHAEDDGVISALIDAAIADFETQSGVRLRLHTREAVYTKFPQHNYELTLSYRPVASVVSLKYIDTESVEQTLVAGTDYQAITAEFQGKIYVGVDKNWPVTKAGRKDAVKARYTVGYAAGVVPADILNALKVLIAHRYEHRGDNDKAKDYPPAYVAVINTHSTAVPG